MEFSDILLILAVRLMVKIVKGEIVLRMEDDQNIQAIDNVECFVCFSLMHDGAGTISPPKNWLKKMV